MSSQSGALNVPRFLRVRPDWLALHSEPAIEPDLPIVDCHHHLWDRPGWRYLLDELLEDMTAGHRVVATVFIQCWAMHRGNGPKAFSAVGETEFANGVAAMSASLNYGPTRVCAGIVSYADLRLGAVVEEVLNAHIVAGGGRFRGVRQIAAWDADEILVNPESGASAGMLEDQRFREGFSRLAPLGLSFEAWLYHPQIKELVPLARAFPETLIVLNHAGGPVGIGPYAGKRDEVFAAWSASIIELATCPNVFLKFGGLGMRVNGLGFDRQATPPSSERVASVLSPFFDVCVSAFGSDRCMFESNFPVDKGSYSYVVCWNAFKRMTGGASAEEKAKLFSRTAARFYKLDISSDSRVP